VFSGSALTLAICLVALFVVPATRLNAVFEEAAVVIVFPAIVLFGGADEHGASWTPTLLFLGRLSYPLYIVHYSMLKLFANYLFVHQLVGPALYLGIGLEIVSVVLLAHCALVFVDIPVKSLLAKRRTHPTLRPSSTRLASTV
jgi:peptidoglycan/LPS O-acetylase OafA/YrhL